MSQNTGLREKRSFVSFVLSLLVGIIILRYAIMESEGYSAILLLFLGLSIVLISLIYFFFPHVGKQRTMYECKKCGKLSEETFHGFCENCYRTYYADANRFVKKV